MRRRTLAYILIFLVIIVGFNAWMLREEYRGDEAKMEYRLNEAMEKFVPVYSAVGSRSLEFNKIGRASCRERV